MTAVELAEKVKAVRDAQKAYFAARDGYKLRESKRLEKELDKAVDVILGGAVPVEFEGRGREHAKIVEIAHADPARKS